MNELEAILLDAYGEEGEPQRRGLKSPDRRGLLVAGGLAAAFGTSLLAACGSDQDGNPEDSGKPEMVVPNQDELGSAAHRQRIALETQTYRRVEEAKAAADPTFNLEIDPQTHALTEQSTLNLLEKLYQNNPEYLQKKPDIKTLRDWETHMGVMIRYENSPFKVGNTDPGAVGENNSMEVWRIKLDGQGGQTTSPIIKVNCQACGVIEVSTYMEDFESKEKITFIEKSGAPDAECRIRPQYKVQRHTAYGYVDGQRGYAYKFTSMQTDKENGTLHQWADKVGEWSEYRETTGWYGPCGKDNAACVNPRTHHSTLHGSSMDLE